MKLIFLAMGKAERRDFSVEKVYSLNKWLLNHRTSIWNMSKFFPYGIMQKTILNC